MARYRGSVCRLCRREGIKLYLKGSRCETENVLLKKEPILLASMVKGGPSSRNTECNFVKSKK